MDPLSALGIAASIAQFLQFGGSLVSKSCEIYSHGALLGHADLESAMKRFIQLADSMKTSLGELEVLGPLSSDSKVLEVICGNCMELSQELLMRLEDLRINGNHSSRKWKSFRQALKSVCSTTKIDGIAMRLEKYQDELNLHLVTSIKLVFL
jgi:hypothetical protein